MTELRYRAYISYSHKDEAWAAWLHGALESYRVPRNLVGTRTSVGEVPARIRPVFRDRDDLSSATDLEDTVKQALADSESLIVLCSPDAAASQWVKEEIRYFAHLGRADRIFCIIVGGEPAADGSVSACFSSALAEIGIQEPLAADARKWADGKYVAKLKLIAGLLGLRLDELRQRDSQRRHKRQLIVGLGIVAALTLAIMTVFSQISERHEREKNEQLATFVVDLGERLQSDADLETLALISTEASRHLQSLKPDKLSPDTGKKVALAIRQMGWVSQHQGSSDAALDAFQRSRDLLGNAEYYIGNLHNRQGRYENALESMQTYYSLSRTLLDSDPDNPDWILEVSYSHNNLAAVHMDSGKRIDEATLAHSAEAIRLIEMVMALKPGDHGVARFYAITLAWNAAAQFQACNLADAMALRARVRDLAEASTRTDPGNNDLKQGYAYALTGIARAQIVTGRFDLAEQNLRFAISILQQLFAADISNNHYRVEVFYRQVILAKLLSDTGQLNSAKSLMEELELEFEPGAEITEQAVIPEKEYTEFLLVYADVESQLGNVESANKHLQAVIQLQLNNPEQEKEDIFYAQNLVRTRYQWWQLNGKDDFKGFPILPVFGQPSAGEYRSCIEADSAARMFVIEDDKSSAASEVAYLRARGYADPNFIRFCKQHELCGN